MMITFSSGRSTFTSEIQMGAKEFKYIYLFDLILNAMVMSRRSVHLSTLFPGQA